MCVRCSCSRWRSPRRRHRHGQGHDRRRRRRRVGGRPHRSGTEQQTVTGPDGRFTLEGCPTARRRCRARRRIRPERAGRLVPNGEIEVVLSPAALLETVTVTPLAQRGAAGQHPGERQHPRQPTRSGRRRPSWPTTCCGRFRHSACSGASSSLSSHPTTQGVSLRGIGPSGVSRTLVLVDGVPFNDPFGGWVYWTRVPMDSVDRIEVVDGSSSSLYGNYAMGGVINIVSSRPSRRTVELKTQYGNQRHAEGRFLRLSDVWGKVGVAVEGSVFDTDGFPIVVENERGVDRQQRYGQLQERERQARLQPDRRMRMSFSAAGYFSEDRGNGKIDGSQRHGWTVCERRRAAPPARRKRPPGLALHRLLDVPQHVPGRAGDDARRATASGSRSTRRVPTDSVGGMAQWSKAFGTSHTSFTVGGDWRRVDGDSNEDTLQPARADRLAGHRCRAALQRVSGGTQRSIGAFVQDVFTPVEPAGGHAERADRRLEELRRAQSRDQRPRGHPRRRATTRTSRTRTTRWAARRVARAVSRERSGARLGRLQHGVPRADAQRAVSLVFGRRGADLREQSARAPSA